MVACVLLVYANVLPAQFVADDALYLTYASRARTAVDLIPFFTTPLPLDPVLAPVETQVYRPVFFLYGVLAYRMWGARPWAWHAANVLLHALGACLVLIVLRRLFGIPPGAALVACLFWAVHPVQVEAVTYVMGANYLLSAIFLLLAVLFTCGWWPGAWPRPARAMAASCAFAISVLSHELGLMAPALAALALAAAPEIGYAWGHRLDRGAVTAWGAMAAAAVAYVALRLTLIGAGTAGHLVETASNLGSRLLQAPEILLRYLGLLAFPFRLTLDRSHDIPPPSGALDPRVLLAWGLCALLALGLARIARRVPLAPIGGAWFLLAYFPVSNTLIPVYSGMAERYLYVPSLGILVAVVAVARTTTFVNRTPRAATVAAFLLVVAYGARSVLRNQDWRDELSFYRATVAASPQSAYMQNNLGNVYRRRGEPEQAERAFRAALAADPAYFSAHVRLGELALRAGRLGEGEALFRAATGLRPDYAEGYYGLAIVALRRGQQREALRLLDRASALTPAHIDTNLYLGLTFLSIDPARAAVLLRRFLALAPDDPQAPVARARLLALSPAPAR